MKVWHLKSILNSFLDDDQVLAFKFVIKREKSTHTEQSLNWPRLDTVVKQTRTKKIVVVNSGFENFLL